MSNLAGYAAEGTFSPTPALIVGPDDPMSRQITLLSGQNLTRGAVLGKVATNAGAVTVGEPAFTGTGNGVLTKADPAHGAGVQEGTYTIRLVEAAADAGNFEVRRPDGTVDGYAVVAVAYDGQVKFTIADGSTNFSNAAQFTLAVTIADTSAGKYLRSVAAATDGSQVPVGVLAEDCDASGGDKVTVAHFGGVMNEAALNFGAGHTKTTVREYLRDVGIKLQPSIA